MQGNWELKNQRASSTENYCIIIYIKGFSTCNLKPTFVIKPAKQEQNNNNKQIYRIIELGIIRHQTRIKKNPRDYSFY